MYHNIFTGNVVAYCSYYDTLLHSKLNLILGEKVFFRKGFSQDLETECQKLAILKLLGVLFFKGDYKINRLKPQKCI